MKNKLNNRYLILGIAVLLMNASCTPSGQKSFSIKGTIKGVDSGTVLLRKFNEADRTTKTLDSVVVHQGHFELTGKLESPEMLTLIARPGNWGTNIFVENSEIVLDADTSGAEHYDYTPYGGDKGANLKNVKISGSGNQDIYDRFENDPEQLHFKKAFAEMNKQYEAEKNPELKEKMRSKFDSVGKLSSAWQIKWIHAFLQKDSGSSAGAYIFNNYYRSNTSMPLTDMDALLRKFTGDAKKSVYYTNLIKEANLRRALLPGKPAPDFTLLKRDSTSFTLSSTRGKYIMLDFWASWCKPCREAIPHWKEVYAKYKDKGFEIISISDDSRKADWIKAMDQEKMPWTQVVDEFPVKNMPARVGTLYQTHFIPFYVLLDKEGKILVYSGNEKDIDAKLKDLLM